MLEQWLGRESSHPEVISSLKLLFYMIDIFFKKFLYFLRIQSDSGGIEVDAQGLDEGGQ